MADALTVRLKPALAKRLEAVAAIAGQSPAEYAVSLVRSALDDDWAEADAALAEYDRTGEAIPAEEALAEFAKNVTARTVRTL